MRTLTAEDRAKGHAKARYTKSLPAYRSAWLNMHLGGFHWIHNDLTDWNLKAPHPCSACQEFRQAHFLTAKSP